MIDNLNFDFKREDKQHQSTPAGGGQVFKFTGFISDEGSVAPPERTTDDHIAILTYWQSFDQHEESHADKVFNEKFSALAEKCEETYEVGYEMLWQGVPE